jgi:hypothetical protein
MKFLWVTLLLFLTAFGLLLWTSDQVTWQGERTIYAATCEGGNWVGLRCTGQLAAGDRHRFRASKSRHEVIYWIAGSKAPSGKFTDCDVKDRDNWTCNAQIGQPPVIAFELSHGRPTAHLAGLTLPYHGIAKVKWLALGAGLGWSDEADFSNESPAARPGKH